MILPISFLWGSTTIANIVGIALSSLMTQFNASSVSFAAGVMVFVSTDQFVPLAYEHDGMHCFALGLIASIDH